MASGTTAVPTVNDWQTVEHPDINDWQTVGPSKTQADYEREHPESEQIRKNMVAGATGVAQAFNPIEIARGLGHTILHPIDTANGIIGLPAHLKELYDSGQHEQLMEEVGKALGSVAMAKAIPEVPNAARAVGNAAETAKTVLTDAGTGMKAAAKSPGVHAAAIGSSVIPVIGPKIAAGIEGVNMARGALKGIREGSAARAAAADAMPAIVPPLPDRTIINTSPRVSLSDALKIQPEAAQPIPEAVVTPDIAAAAKARLAENLANRRPALTPTPNASVSEAIAPQTAADAELLNGLAQALTKKPFARLNTVEQTAIRDLAKKGAPPATPVAVPATEVAPNASVSQAISPKPPSAGFDEMLRQTLERLRAKSESDVGGEIEPLHMRAEEPEDYSSLLEQSIAEAKAKTLSNAIKNFAKKKDK